MHQCTIMLFTDIGDHVMEGFPSFSDKEFWDDALKKYVERDVRPSGDNGYVWAYFKHCLQTQNRFFFQNPLVPVIIERYHQNVFELSTDNPIYRARIDQERKKRVFEGFDAKESGAPPYCCVKTGGRCNPEYVSFLYAANDIHTAVAEVRPYFRDSVSIATLLPKRVLRLVDFYYELKKQGPVVIEGPDPFMNKLCSEFSILNKGNEKDYLITQYLTLLAQNEGFDGIRFRSSLVRKGVNYVIFDNSNCIPVESKMYNIPDVTYSIIPMLDT